MTPARRIAPAPWMTAPDTGAVMAALAAGGAAARFVGGCVRDTVAARTVKDIDIATPLHPERVMELIQAAGLKAVPTGIGHGTVTAVALGKPFEITTLRRDVETYGRRARVAFTDDWDADAARRDFTINALYADPDGTIYDPTGGLADIARGRVRFVGEARERIAEDVLRLLRFFRFHAFYGKGRPDAAALAACRDMAPRLPTLSGERVRAELFRLLVADDPRSVLALMARREILAHFLPELADLARLGAMARIEDRLGLPRDPVRRLAGGLAASRRRLLAIAERLRLSNFERDRLLAIAAPVKRPTPALSPKSRRRALYRMGAATFRDRALLAWAAEGGRGAAGPWRALLAEAEAWQRPRLPLAGRDLKALGLGQGPAIGKALAAVETWWIARDFRPGRLECLGYLEKAITEGGTGLHIGR